ncbi:MAG: stage III sporulation protein AF [Clostridiales bacterium]|nr:stage III sporulation protein AF [Clostridiales bacterium]
MDILNKWIYTIVVIMILAAFLDILMPNSSMKKYTRLVLGLLIMSVILQPVLKIMNKNYSFSLDSSKYESQLSNEYMKNQTENYSTKQSLEVVKLYKQNLEKEIGDQVKKEIGSDRDITVEVGIIDDEKNKNYLALDNITIHIGKLIKQVDKVVINDDESGKADKGGSESFKELKKHISAIYNIDADKVRVYAAS